MTQNRGLGDRPTERSEQAAFWKTRNAREAARIRRVQAQRERADREAKKGKK